MVTPYKESKYFYYVAILIAVSLPAIILGRTTLAVLLICAFFFAVFATGPKVLLQKASAVIYSPISGLILIVAVIWSISLFTSVDVSRSVATELRTILYIVLMIPLWTALIQDEKYVELCLKSLAISSLVLGAVALIALNMPSSFIGTLRGNPSSSIVPIRILKESASSAILIIPLLGWFMWRHKNIWRLIGGLAILVMYSLVFLTKSRSAFAGLLGGAFVVVILYNLYRRNGLVIGMSILIGVCLAGASVYWLYETRGWTVGIYGGETWPLPEWLIDPPRQAIWKFTWEAGESHRWFGVGINVIDRLPGADSWNPETGTRNIPLHPHNWIVEITIETGLVGLVAFLSLIGVFAAKHIKHYAQSGSPALLAMGGIWGAYWISGLFSFSYWSSWWQVSFLATTVICLAGDFWYEKSRN